MVRRPRQHLLGRGRRTRFRTIFGFTSEFKEPTSPQDRLGGLKAFNPTWPHDLEVRLGSVKLSQKHTSKSNASNAILDAEPRTQAMRRTHPPPATCTLNLSGGG